MFSDWAEVTVLQKCRSLQKRINNIQTVLGNGWHRLQNAGGKLVVLSPTPFPLKMSLIPKFRSCVSMLTEMKGERTVAFPPLDYSGLYFSAWFSYSEFLGAKVAFSS